MKYILLFFFILFLYIIYHYSTIREKFIDVSLLSSAVDNVQDSASKTTANVSASTNGITSNLSTDSLSTVKPIQPSNIGYSDYKKYDDIVTVVNNSNNKLVNQILDYNENLDTYIDKSNKRYKDLYKTNLNLVNNSDIVEEEGSFLKPITIYNGNYETYGKVAKSINYRIEHAKKNNVKLKEKATQLSKIIDAENLFT